MQQFRAADGRLVMDEKSIDHEHRSILKVTKLLKGLDLAEKEIALSILSNILKIYIEVAPNRSIEVHQEEDEGEPGFTVGTNGPELQIFIPRHAPGRHGDGIHSLVATMSDGTPAWT
jgi:hypothetical protein